MLSKSLNTLFHRSQFRVFSTTTAKSVHQRKVVVAVANGSEEIETVTIIDTLRRANIEVNVSKVGDEESLECLMSRGVKLVGGDIIDYM